MPIQQPAILSPRHTATRLCVSPHTLAKWRVTGDGPPFIKIGSRVFYDESDVALWVATRRRTSTSSTHPESLQTGVIQ